MYAANDTSYMYVFLRVSLRNERKLSAARGKPNGVGVQNIMASGTLINYVV